MKKLITKAQLRREMEQQMADFLGDGGQVLQVDPGISGHDSLAGPLKPDLTTFQEPRVQRTYVPDVVAALEARKHPPKPPPTKKRPKKKVVYDDFGEPLRWQWED